MKTKTLLVAAATLAAGALASQAQVYSANVVGYYNVTVPANGFQIVANQLINGTDANQTNDSIAGIFSGLVSDPNDLSNTVLYYWNGAGYNTWSYFTASDADNYFLGSGMVAGFYDTGGTVHSSALAQESGSFLYNAFNSPIVITLVGTVPQGTNVSSLVSGFNMLSSAAPVSTNVESTYFNLPLSSDPNDLTNDVLYYWNGAGYNTWTYFTASDADNYFLGSGMTTGFYDTGGTVHNTQIPVGQSFFLFRYGSSVSWTNSFVVQ